MTTSVGLLDLNDDVLRIISEAAAFVHPPHWEFPGADRPHNWQPPPLSSGQAETGADFYPNKYFCLGWIYLSHVSSRLRAIVLNLPALWARVVLAMPSSSSHRIILSRARDMPLYLNVPPQPWRTTRGRRRRARAKASFATTIVNRASEINITEHMCLDWATLDIHEFPILCRLALDQRGFKHDRMDINATNLVSLVLRGSLPMFPSPLPFLRELDIRSCSDIIPIHADLQSQHDLVLRALSRTPALERLSLVFESAIEFTVSSSRHGLELPIRLPHLRSASIQFETLELDTPPENPWTYIEAPDNVSIRFGFEWFVKWPTVQWANICSSAAHQLGSKAYNNIQIVMSRSFDISFNRGNDQRGVQFYEGACHNYDDILRLLPRYVYTEGIQSLHITVTRETALLKDGVALHAFFISFSNISVLTVETDEKTTDDTYRILVDIASSRDNRPAAFPSLETLVVRCVSIKRDKITMKAFSALWASIYSFLKTRAESGGRVRHLVLSGMWHRERVLNGGGRQLVMLADNLGMSVAGGYVDDIVDERIAR
ncbi:hypothetical protein PENSPDRAFT_658173 [Peniophora sp. CONT]|nr:hypothetical protein PENSPDRAFT_658173 [Peniophora sp. CONT]